jgi:hypothetical protein
MPHIVVWLFIETANGDLNRFFFPKTIIDPRDFFMTHGYFSQREPATQNFLSLVFSGPLAL